MTHPIINAAEHAWVIHDERFPLDQEVATCPNSFPDYEQSGEDLIGLYLHTEHGWLSSLEPYLLAYFAGTDQASEIADRFDSSQVVALGVRGVGMWGSSELKTDFVYETGSLGGDDFSAFAAALSTSHTFGDDVWWKPIVGFDYATGDDDPTDGERQEFFNFFPTNHLHYGYLDLFGWRNIVEPWAALAAGCENHSVQLKVHGFWLDQEKGRWSSASGATLGQDPEGQSGTEVGKELNLTYKTKVFEKVHIHTGYALFAPSEFAKRTRGDDPAHFFYLEATVRF